MTVWVDIASAAFAVGAALFWLSQRPESYRR